MFEKQAESPVLKIKLGTTTMQLITELSGFAADWEKWRNDNSFQAPEVALATKEAYKVALATELIFTNEVRTHDLARKLERQNGGMFNVYNFSRACDEVAKLL